MGNSSARSFDAPCLTFAFTLLNSITMLISAGGSLFGTLTGFGHLATFTLLFYPALGTLVVAGIALALSSAWDIDVRPWANAASAVVVSVLGAAAFVAAIVVPEPDSNPLAIAAGILCALAYLLQFMAWSRRIAKGGFKAGVRSVAFAAAIAAACSLLLFSFTNSFVMTAGFTVSMIAGAVCIFVIEKVENPKANEEGAAASPSDGHVHRTRDLWPLFAGSVLCLFTLITMWQGVDDANLRPSSPFITQGMFGGFIACSLGIGAIAAMHPNEALLERRFTTLCPLFAALPVIPCIIPLQPDAAIGAVFGVLTGVGFAFFMATPIAAFCRTAYRDDMRKVWGTAAIVMAVGGLVGRVVATGLPANAATALTVGMFLAFLVACALIPKQTGVEQSASAGATQADAPQAEAGAQAQAALANPLSARCTQLSASWKLTKREEEVLPLLASGKTQPAIAKELFCSPETVKVHVRHIYEKAGVHSRDELIDLVRGK